MQPKAVQTALFRYQIKAIFAWQIDINQNPIRQQVCLTNQFWIDFGNSLQATDDPDLLVL